MAEGLKDELEKKVLMMRLFYYVRDRPSAVRRVTNLEEFPLCLRFSKTFEPKTVISQVATQPVPQQPTAGWYLSKMATKGSVLVKA